MRRLWLLPLLLVPLAAGCGPGAGDNAFTGKHNLISYQTVGPIQATIEFTEKPVYVTATVGLVVSSPDDDRKLGVLWTQGAEMRNWLILYLVNQDKWYFTVSGKPDGSTPGLHRMRREIREGLNELLWPGEAGQIKDVLFEALLVHDALPAPYYRMGQW